VYASHDTLYVLAVLASPEGLEAVHEAFPEVVVVTGEVDAGLNHDKYIVPGLGDFGDR
jgi:uracil phosphoribosyltransferase